MSVHGILLFFIELYHKRFWVARGEEGFLVIFLMKCFGWGEFVVFLGVAPREKIFTFEKTNSFKRGGVRTVFVGLVTIMTWVRCLGA